jgi:hypothetical protein
MAAIINGTAVNFGFTGTNGITITGISGTLLQSAEHESMADVEITRDGLGAEVCNAFYNPHENAKLEWVVTGSGLAAAITNSALIAAGTFFVITACASMPSLIASTWQALSGCKLSGTNVNSKKLSVSLKKCPNITAVASA